MASTRQNTASSTANTVTDSRRAVGDQGVLAEGGSYVDQSVNDNRNFDDHSSFAVDASDHSVTTVYSVDPEIAKANAEASMRAFDAAEDISVQAFSTVEGNNAKAFEFARGSGADALAVATSAFEKAAELIGGDAEKSREFAGSVAAGLFNSAKSADQQIAENITKAITAVFIVGALAWALKGNK